MAQPSKLPRWADVGGSIVEPLESLKDQGWVPGMKPAAQHTNWWWNLVYQWCNYLKTITNEALTWTARQTFTGGLTVPASSPGTSDAARRSEVEALDAAAVTAAVAAANAHSDAYANARFVVAGRVRGSDASILSQSGSVTVSAVRNATGDYWITVPGLTSNAVVVTSLNAFYSKGAATMTVSGGSHIVDVHTMSDGVATDIDFSFAVLVL